MTTHKKEKQMLTHYLNLILNYAYRRIHPGGAFEAFIKQQPDAIYRLDKDAQRNLAEIWKFAYQHLDHSSWGAQGFENWVAGTPTEAELTDYYKYYNDLIKTDWTQVDTSHG